MLYPVATVRHVPHVQFYYVTSELCSEQNLPARSLVIVSGGQCMMKKLGELLITAVAVVGLTEVVRFSLERRIGRSFSGTSAVSASLPRMDRGAKELQREMVVWLSTTDGVGPGSEL